MRAAFMYGAGDVRVIDVADPGIQQPTDAIVRVVRACICGSDLHPYHSMPVTPDGQSMGHEFIGIVEDTGADVTSVKKGDLVIAPFAWSDGTCDFCREGPGHGYQAGPQGPRTPLKTLVPTPTDPTEVSMTSTEMPEAGTGGPVRPAGLPAGGGR
jgi:threonine dehydrogenase-like Zn-dependent dehydrogenase